MDEETIAQLSPKARAKLQLLIDDFPTYARECLKIKTKEGSIVSFRLNATQRILHQKFEEQLKAIGKVRAIILKARREGVSTYVQGRFFHRAVMNPYLSALTAAHDIDSSDIIFRMGKIFYDFLPEPMKPARAYSNRKEIAFNTPDGKGLNSNLLVDTAGNMELGRAFTLQMFHGSEVAFWSNAKESMLGVTSAVGDVPGSMIVIESTANGVGGWFWEAYWRAKRGESEYQAIFLPWFIFPEYRKPVPAGFQPSEFEFLLQEKHHLDLEQLAWRRWAIENLCDGDEDKFRQEYPATDEEAFLVSGNPVFSHDKLREMAKHIERPIWIGNLVPKPGYPDRPQLETTSRGFIRIWRMPERFHHYVIGGDVASGIKGGDYSTGQVLDRNTWQVVAEWHGHIDPDLFGQQLCFLGTLYNKAFVGVEINKDGITVVRYMRDHYKGPLYSRMSYDSTADKVVHKLGWLTDGKTRPLMINDLATAIRQSEIHIYNLELIQELLTFVRDEKGNAAAQEGSFDDRVIALAIAIQMAKYVVEGEKPKEKTLADMIAADIAAAQRIAPEADDTYIEEL
jgi:hypothetical protein